VIRSLREELQKNVLFVPSDYAGTLIAIVALCSMKNGPGEPPYISEISESTDLKKTLRDVKYLWTNLTY
jgi:hypothetical protein